MSSTFDPAALDELFELEADSPDLVKTLIDDYVQVSQRLINQIETAFNAVDYPALDIAAHSLKSSSQALGFSDVAKVCLILETAAKKKDVLSNLTSEVESLAALRTLALNEAVTFLNKR